MTDVVQAEKRCARCGEVKSAEHYSSQGNGRLRLLCKPCDVARTRDWRARNREERRAYEARYRETCRERARLYAAAWRQRNPKYSSEYHAKNREKHRASSADWYARNRERELVRSRDWKRAHPTELAHHSATRRARKTGNGGSHTVKEWRDKCAEYESLRLLRTGEAN